MTAEAVGADSAFEQMLQSLQPEIQARSAWAGDREPTGPLEAEDDVRFLLVHHTASTNAYTADTVVDQIQDFYDLHVGRQRGWPDVAYNFLIDKFGGIWEGRQGSIDGPVRGDATGGSQGHALLCSLIGDHTQTAPTAEAIDSLSRLLAWLGVQYRVDTSPGATVEFVSRGSNRWPAGMAVTTSTIAGHRDMSDTTCPGQYLYPLLSTDVPKKVEQLRLAVETNIGEAIEETAQDAADTNTSSGSGAAVAPTEERRITSSVIDDEQALSPASDDGLEELVVPAGVTVAAALLGGLIALRRRRVNRTT